MKRFLHYWITISDNKYHADLYGLLELNPMTKCTVCICHAIIVTSCPTSSDLEENAVRYVGGYVIRTLKQQKKHEDICHILEELTDNSPRSDHEDEPEAPANDWVTIIDRGGLTRITTDAYQLFYTIELCTRRYFHLNNVTSMDNTFRSHVDNCILNDDDVLFGVWQARMRMTPSPKSVWKVL